MRGGSLTAGLAWSAALRDKPVERAWPWLPPGRVKGHHEREVPATRYRKRIDFVTTIQQSTPFIEVRVIRLKLFEEQIGTCHAPCRGSLEVLQNFVAKLPNGFDRP